MAGDRLKGGNGQLLSCEAHRLGDVQSKWSNVVTVFSQGCCESDARAVCEAAAGLRSL